MKRHAIVLEREHKHVLLGTRARVRGCARGRRPLQERAVREVGAGPGSENEGAQIPRKLSTKGALENPGVGYAAPSCISCPRAAFSGETGAKPGTDEWASQIVRKSLQAILEEVFETNLLFG